MDSFFFVFHEKPGTPNNYRMDRVIYHFEALIVLIRTTLKVVKNFSHGKKTSLKFLIYGLIASQ